MSAINFWKLCTEYSVYQAAMLVAGHDPQDYEELGDSEVAKKARGYAAVRTALCNAINGGSLHTAAKSHFDDYGDTSLNIYQTLVRVSDLDAFVKAAGLVCEIFDRTSQPAACRLTASNPYYSRKLDAANKAWAAVTSDRRLLAGKSPKQALQKWLGEHAAEFGLISKDGKPNVTGIEEICKVANWKPEGGATPTQGFLNSGTDSGFTATPPLQERERQPQPRESFSADLDDDIPF
jgi:hypothetical protein